MDGETGITSTVARAGACALAEARNDGRRARGRRDYLVRINLSLRVRRRWYSFPWCWITSSRAPSRSTRLLTRRTAAVVIDMGRRRDSAMEAAGDDSSRDEGDIGNSSAATVFR